MMTDKRPLQGVVGDLEIPGVGAGNGGLELASRALFSKILDGLSVYGTVAFW